MIKFIFEFLPLFAFFIAYKFYGIKIATIVIVLSTVATSLLNYIYNKHLNALTIVTTVIVAVMGSMTIMSNNPIFIKMKPTVVSLIFAAILLFGIVRKQGYLKQVLGSKIDMHDHAWIELSKRFALLFIFLAALNEIVWRVCPEGTWVTFKVFGISIITCLFVLAHASFFNRNKS